MLKATCNFRNVSRLDLLEWSCHQRTTEDLVSLGKIKLILYIIVDLVVELLTQVYADLVLIIISYKQIISIVLDKLWKDLLILLLVNMISYTYVIITHLVSLMNQAHHFLHIREDFTRRIFLE